jgi:hypothetical protein
MDLYICFDWNTVEILYYFLRKRSEFGPVTIPIINDKLFDEFFTVRTPVEFKFKEWRQKDLSYENRWLDILYFNQVHITTRTFNVQVNMLFVYPVHLLQWKECFHK